MQKKEQDQRYDEDQPSGKDMKEALGSLRIPVLYKQARAHNARTVGEHRDRNGSQRQY